VNSLLTADGIRFVFTSAVRNFLNFGPVGVILVAMVGVGLAEQAGLIGALIHKLINLTPRRAITFIVVFLGICSSIASDAGYLVLIPLGASVFLSLGRHPLAGLAAAFSGVGAVFGVNLLITPIDGILTEITNDAIHLLNPSDSIVLPSYPPSCSAWCVPSLRKNLSSHGWARITGRCQAGQARACQAPKRSREGWPMRSMRCWGLWWCCPS
jgi:aminobenzoyl-glutamate transport protein